MKQPICYLWIQRKSYQDSTILIKNGVQVCDGADNYPTEYNAFHSLLKRQRTVLVNNDLTIGLTLSTVSISGNFTNRDEANRRVPYSFITNSDSTVAVSQLVKLAKEQGLIIPEDEIHIMEQTICHEKRILKKRCRYIVALVVVGVIAVSLIIKLSASETRPDASDCSIEDTR